MSNNPTPQQEVPAGAWHPMGPPHWGLSQLDWHAHAIDEDADRPYGVYVTRCGQRLFMDTSLHDEPPGWVCLSCLRWTDPRTPPRGTVMTDLPLTPPEARERPTSEFTNESRLKESLANTTPHQRTSNR